ncbi:hypothetical protein NOC27_2387 [Nitrosococcus oceani AFC27]|nr:hypothetical protein NOC27_2387 [Nitrosococcus oceani AFC27]
MHMRPTGPWAKTTTLPPMGILAFSAAMNPVLIMSHTYTADSSGTPLGISARLASASLTCTYSAKVPSLILANFQPPSAPPDCDEWPPWAASEPQSGVIAPTATRSPCLKLATSAPTSSTTPTASCPRVRFSRSPTAPWTVCTSDVQISPFVGRRIASRGPQVGRSFSTTPTCPMFNITNAFMETSSAFGTINKMDHPSCP